jgi:formylglycine-generating enzyme required for sulfatase activity
MSIQLNQPSLFGYNPSKAIIMKRHIALLVFILGLVNSSFGGVPDKPKKATVYSIVKQKQTPEWYWQQAGLWKAELDKNQSNQEAWLNYYTAQRMRKILHAGVSHEELKQIVKDMEQAIPNTFEYHYVAYWNGDHSSKNEHSSHLFKALELGPNRIELYSDLFTHYMLTNDKANMQSVAKNWYSSNDIAAGVYNWNYNMLQSVESNSVLITSGDNDTYPALVLQLAKEIRTDVVVINNSLLALPEYRNAKFREAGIKPMTKILKDFNSWPEYQKATMEHIKTNIDRPFYFAVSAQPFLYEDYKAEIHNVGLAYKWSSERFDNIAVLKKNYEKEFLTDYLKFEFSNSISQGVVDHANSNYLIPLLTLFNHYCESEDAKAAELEQIIDRIAKRNGMEKKVAEVLEKSTKKSVSLVVDDPRLLTRGMVKTEGNLYASQFEVSNEQYELFLTDLLKQKRYEELEIAKAVKVDWKNLRPDWKDLSEKEMFPHGHPDDPKHPVVNISYDAAHLYCKWLTEVYNNTDHKKKQFKQVMFRLPTEDEWEMIAHAGLELSPFAWGGPYYRNSKGCYLGNLDVSDQKVIKSASEECASCGRQDDDGGFYTVPVTSYSPNGFGLFCITGNVAEMVQEKGKVKGGSWATLTYSTFVESSEIAGGIDDFKRNDDKKDKLGTGGAINGVEKIETPSPQVGFRVIMEVIQ